MLLAYLLQGLVKWSSNFLFNSTTSLSLCCFSHCENARSCLSVHKGLSLCTASITISTGDLFLTHLLQLLILVLINHFDSPVFNFTIPRLCISPDHLYCPSYPFSPFSVFFLLAKLCCFYPLSLSFFHSSTFVQCAFTSAVSSVLSKPL